MNKENSPVVNLSTRSPFNLSGVKSPGNKDTGIWLTAIVTPLYYHLAGEAIQKLEALVAEKERELVVKQQELDEMTQQSFCKEAMIKTLIAQQDLMTEELEDLVEKCNTVSQLAAENDSLKNDIERLTKTQSQAAQNDSLLEINMKLQRKYKSVVQQSKILDFDKVELSTQKQSLANVLDQIRSLCCVSPDSSHSDLVSAVTLLSKQKNDLQKESKTACELIISSLPASDVQLDSKSLPKLSQIAAANLKSLQESLKLEEELHSASIKTLNNDLEAFRDAAIASGKEAADAKAKCKEIVESRVKLESVVSETRQLLSEMLKNEAELPQDCNLPTLAGHVKSMVSMRDSRFNDLSARHSECSASELSLTNLQTKITAIQSDLAATTSQRDQLIELMGKVASASGSYVSITPPETSCFDDLIPFSSLLLDAVVNELRTKAELVASLESEVQSIQSKHQVQIDVMNESVKAKSLSLEEAERVASQLKIHNDELVASLAILSDDFEKYRLCSKEDEQKLAAIWENIQPLLNAISESSSSYSIHDVASSGLWSDILAEFLVRKDELEAQLKVSQNLESAIQIQSTTNAKLSAYVTAFIPVLQMIGDTPVCIDVNSDAALFEDEVMKASAEINRLKENLKIQDSLAENSRHLIKNLQDELKSHEAKTAKYQTLINLVLTHLSKIIEIPSSDSNEFEPLIEETLQKATCAIKTLQNTLQEAQSSNKEMSTTISGLKARIVELDKSIEDSALSSSQLDGKMARMESELRAEVTNLTENLQQAEAQASTTKHDWELEKEKLAGETLVLNERLCALSDVNEDIVRSRNMLQAELDALKLNMRQVEPKERTDSSVQTSNAYSLFKVVEDGVEMLNGLVKVAAELDGRLLESKSPNSKKRSLSQDSDSLEEDKRQIDVEISALRTELSDALKLLRESTVQIADADNIDLALDNDDLEQILAVKNEELMELQNDVQEARRKSNLASELLAIRSEIAAEVMDIGSSSETDVILVTAEKDASAFGTRSESENRESSTQTDIQAQSDAEHNEVLRFKNEIQMLRKEIDSLQNSQIIHNSLSDPFATASSGVKVAEPDMTNEVESLRSRCDELEKQMEALASENFSLQTKNVDNLKTIERLDSRCERLKNYIRQKSSEGGMNNTDDASRAKKRVRTNDY